MSANTFNVAAGNWFFRYRNALFPILFFAVPLALPPRIMFGNPAVDRALIICGVLIAFAGAAVRLTTIGYDYIERGGKEGKVYASRLVQGGVYASTRNPMYVGNGLIAIGMSMAIGSPAAYVTVIPFFLWIYHAIISAEEAYLRRQFGPEYDAYCARVPRLVPSLPKLRAALAGNPYNWRQAFRKDLGTITGLLMGTLGLRIFRIYRLDGWSAAKADAPVTLSAMALVLLAYAFFHHLKKQRRFFYSPEEVAGTAS